MTFPTHIAPSLGSRNYPAPRSPTDQLVSIGLGAGGAGGQVTLVLLSSQTSFASVVYSVSLYGLLWA